MSADNNLTRDGVDIENTGKKNRFDIIKIIILVILLFSIIVGLTFAILYLTNPKAKKLADDTYTRITRQREEKQIEEIKGDTRISEIADYYLTLEEEDAVLRLQNIKNQDKKLYEKIQSSMDIINPAKSLPIKNRVNEKKDKSKILDEEYNNVLQEKAALTSGKSGFYSSLGVRGAIDAIEEDIGNTMDYDGISKTLEYSSPDETAKILYFMNPVYVDGIKNRFSKDYLRQVEEETRIYAEFLRRSDSYSVLYGKMKPNIAAMDLQNEDMFSNEDVAAILSKMNYLEAAKILHEFEDENKSNEILQNIKEVEDYQIEFDGSLSAVIANTLKVLKKFDEDVDILKKAYEKMKPADLADLMDKHVSEKPVYRTYIVDTDRSFTISEKDMAIKALKLIKPQLVADMLSELENSERIDKAAQISREIGIPMP